MTAKATYDGYGTSGWLTRVEPVITSKPFLCETPSPRHNPRLRSWLHHNIHKILLLAKPSKQCKKFSLLCIVLWGYSSLKPASHTNLCWDLTNFPHFICKRWPLASLLINQWDLLMSTCWSSMFADRNDWYDGARGYAGHATTRGRSLRKSWIRRIGCLVVCVRALS